MSGGRYLLLYLGTDGDGPWLRLADNRVVARGTLTDVPAPDDEQAAAETVVGIVPGSDVAIHWVELPDLAEAQSAAAARLMASEVSAERLDNLHVSLGASSAGEAERIMGVTAADLMAAWLAEAQGAGFDPDALVPETLLLEPVGDGIVTTESGALVLVRGPRTAFAAEAELLALLSPSLFGPNPRTAISADEVEARLGAVLAAIPLDLRTGPFRKRRRWRIDWPLLRRLALMGALAFAVNALIQLTLIAKYSAAADRAEARTEAIARRALPRMTPVTDPVAQLTARASELRGGGAGLSATLGGLFEALRATPNVEVQALTFDASGTLRATLSAANGGDLGVVRTALDGRGLVTESGDMRAAGARQVVEYRISGS